jgi:Fe-S-cluster-containing dehydrogenase component
MAHYAMLIDPARCTGCAACRIACQMQWQLPPAVFFNRLEFREHGKYPQVRQEIVPVQCMHCDNPPCATVCPTGATYKREDGLVLIDHKKCIGCKYCVVACPYDVRQVNDRGIPEKCRFCAGFIEKGETPSCVSTCMNDVRTFGDLDDPTSEISQKMRAKEVYQLAADKGTKPRVFYVKEAGRS